MANFFKGKRRYLLPILAFIVLAAGTAAFSALDISWTGWAPAPCMPGECFCERVRYGPILQPVNTYSNLSFVLVGLLIVSTAIGNPARADIEKAGKRANKPGNLIRSRPAYTLVYGASVIVIGLGSFFYHASLTHVGLWFDLMGMYMLAGFMILYNVARFRDTGGIKFAIVYSLAMAVLGLALIFRPDWGWNIFAAMIGIAIGMELFHLNVQRPRIKRGYLYAALATFSLAYGIWNLDVSGILCEPESWLQGHAIWHILSAAAAGMLYLYYRSEDK